MKPRFMWPVAAVLALGVAVFVLSRAAAQRDSDRGRGSGMVLATPGRFVVAHALAERIVLLDTATGQLYVATERDMKRFSELPKVTTIEDRIRGFRDEMKKDEFKRDGKREKNILRKEERRERDERKEKDKDAP